MRFVDRLSKLVRLGKVSEEVPDQQLTPIEVQLITNNLTEDLVTFAGTSRLHVTDPKGDTPLHIAARIGNLAICDLFISAGADAAAQNNARQTAADLALSEGHLIAAQLLTSLVENSLVDTSQIVSPLTKDAQHETPVPACLALEASHVNSRTAEQEPVEQFVDLDEMLEFHPEVDPEEFFDNSSGEAVSGTFVALVKVPWAEPNDANADWEFDLSPGQVVGEGIDPQTSLEPTKDGENDFLKMRKRGRRSNKRATLQAGTRISVETDACVAWASAVVERGSYNSEDIFNLVSLAEGNGDFNDMCSNLQRTLEAAGLDVVDDIHSQFGSVWDTKSSVSVDELAEAVSAALTRSTRLPGTQRFKIDKALEMRLLEPMVRAKQEMQLAILACEPATEIIISRIDDVLLGDTDPSSITMRSVVPTRLEHQETKEFFEAAETLKAWRTNERVMDGKRRRKALEALEALDLKLSFHKHLLESLAELPATSSASFHLDTLISTFETAVERLILEHLPHARRFAARNVDEGEDPEEVFQVAFIGLQRSTRRFDPELGHRFVIYSTFWMKQALARWRADEGSLIRIPVHRYQRLTELDNACETLNSKLRRDPTEVEMAEALGWKAQHVNAFLQIPRQSNDMSSFDEWPGAILEPAQEKLVDQAATLKLASEALAQIEERQAEIIRMRFGIGGDEEMTLEEIGQIYGVTRERIRQIEGKGLRKLSRPDSKRRTQKQVGN